MRGRDGVKLPRGFILRKSRRNPLKFFGFMALIAGLFAVFYITGWHKGFSAEGARDFILRQGAWGPVIFILSYVLGSLTLFPTAVLSVASGMIWGPFWGTVLTIVAATLASIPPFLLTRFFSRAFVESVIKGSWFKSADCFLSRNGFVSIVLIRLIPFFSWDLVNVVSGMCGFRFRDYVLATFLGTIPATLTYNLIGASLGKPLDPARISMIVLTVLLTLAMSAFYLFRSSRGTENRQSKIA